MGISEPELGLAPNSGDFTNPYHDKPRQLVGKTLNLANLLDQYLSAVIIVEQHSHPISPLVLSPARASPLTF